jgi:uncharacterized damage-inducible protein DinB
MQIIPILLKEMELEAKTTRKMLGRIPEDSFQWKPHEKSMTVERLAMHIAELPGWVTMTLDTSELDFAKEPYDPKSISSTAELVEIFEKNYKEARARLEKATEEELMQKWTLRNGEEIYFTDPKLEVIRMSYSQIVHHRAQLGVFLRLLNVPIPGSYGPSADEQAMVA